MLESRLSRQHDQLCIYCIEKMLHDVMQRADDTSEAIQVKRFYSGRSEHRKCRQPTEVGKEEGERVLEQRERQTEDRNEARISPIIDTSHAQTNSTKETFSTASSTAIITSATTHFSEVAPERSTPSTQILTTPVSMAVASAQNPSPGHIVTKIKVEDDARGDAPISPCLDNNDNANRLDSAETVFYVDNDRHHDFEGLVPLKSSHSALAIEVNDENAAVQSGLEREMPPVSTPSTVGAM